MTFVADSDPSFSREPWARQPSRLRADCGRPRHTPSKFVAPTFVSSSPRCMNCLPRKASSCPPGYYKYDQLVSSIPLSLAEIFNEKMRTRISGTRCGGSPTGIWQGGQGASPGACVSEAHNGAASEQTVRVGEPRIANRSECPAHSKSSGTPACERIVGISRVHPCDLQCSNARVRVLGSLDAKAPLPTVFGEHRKPHPENARAACGSNQRMSALPSTTCCRS